MNLNKGFKISTYDYFEFHNIYIFLDQKKFFTFIKHFIESYKVCPLF